MSHNNSLGGPEILKRRESIAFSNFWLVLVLRSKYKNGREGPGFEFDHLLLFLSSNNDFKIFDYYFGTHKIEMSKPRVRTLPKARFLFKKSSEMVFNLF